MNFAQPSFRRVLPGLLATTVLIGGTAYVVNAQVGAASKAKISTALGAKSKDRPFLSLRATETYIKNVRARAHEKEEKLYGKREAEREREAEGEGEEREEPLEYFEGWLFRQKKRAYPKDNWDRSEIDRAIAQRSRMPGWGSGGGTTGGGGGDVRGNRVGSPKAMGGNAWPGLPTAGITWEFIGPRNARPGHQDRYMGAQTTRISGRVNQVAYDPTNANTVYLASAGGGIWKSTDAGQNWNQLTDKIFERLETGTVAVSPDGKVVLAGHGDYPGFNPGGLHISRSTDGGATWTVVGSKNVFLPPAGQIMNVAGDDWRVTGSTIGISDIVFDPDDPNTVLASAARGFIQLELVADPTVTATIYNGGVFRSTDGGLTWTKIQAILQPPVHPVLGILLRNDFTRLSFGAKNPITGKRFLYASREGEITGPFDDPLLITGLFRSDDSGATWTTLSNGFPGGAFNNQAEVAASKSNPNTVYFVDASEGLLDGRVLRSDNAGEPDTWVDVTGNLPDGDEAQQDPGYNWSQFSYDINLSTSILPQSGPDSDLVYLGAITFSGAVDRGPNWQDITRSYQAGAAVHSDQHGFDTSPADPFSAIVANDGGVYGLTFNGTTRTWSFAGGERFNATLGVTQFYAADWHPTNPDYAMGGTQDNATPHSLGDLANWDNVGVGDGFACAINQSNPQFQYATSQFDNVLATDNGWTTSRTITPDYGGDLLPFESKIALSPAAPEYLYVGTDRLWRFNEATDTWDARLGGQKVTGLLAVVTAVAPSPSNPHIIYTGSSDGQLWMCRFRTTGNGFRDPANALWRRLDVINNIRMIPAGATYSISVNPSNPYDILVGIGGGSRTKLWRCRNTDDAWNGRDFLIFTPTSGLQGSSTELPSLPPAAIERDPNDPNNTYWIGNDIGIFVSRDSGSTWYNAGTTLGLPPVPVNAVKAVRNTGYLNVATFGRGMWRIKLDAFKSELPSPFFVTPSLKRVGNTIQCNLTIKNTRQGIVRSIRVGSGAITPDGQTPVNTSTNLPLAVNPTDLNANQVGTATISFPAAALRSGTSGTLRIGFSTINGAFSNSIRVRIP